MAELESLGEQGFAFLDRQNRPYLCRMWGSQAWLFYWHPEDHWVSLRPVTQAEVWSFPHNLTAAQVQLYQAKHEAWEKRMEVN